MSEVLLAAIRNENIKQLKAAIDEGVDVNCKDKHGFAALHYAASRGNPEIVEWLINHGANVNTNSATDWSPLHDVAKLGNMMMVEFLLSHGANVSIVDSDGKTAADVALEWAEDEIAELLKKQRHCTGVNMLKRTLPGLTAHLFFTASISQQMPTALKKIKTGKVYVS